MVADILDVWFDSGCTHVFTLESGHWPEQRWPADLYLEGSDQHRGWFQSSLLESCGTRGRAPYNAVLTHGFTMDAKGMKMSKSLGNTIDPLEVMETTAPTSSGCGRCRSTSPRTTASARRSSKGVADQYRKLRNTFRYLLGALDGFSEEERLATSPGCPSWSATCWSCSPSSTAGCAQAVDDFDFNSYVRALTDFCNEDLSAFFFDIRKDCLYCDAPATRSGAPTGRARHVVPRAGPLAAPVLVFTTEEVWGTRYPDGGQRPSARMAAIYPKVDADDASRARSARAAAPQVTEAIEPLAPRQGHRLQPRGRGDGAARRRSRHARRAVHRLVSPARRQPVVTKTDKHKCGRCWRLLPEVDEDGELCARCDEVVA